MKQLKSPSCFFTIRGFTLTEMPVALAILSILLILAVIGFGRLIVDTRITSDTNEFLTMLHLARSEAIKRNCRVTICKSSDGVSCSTHGNWSQGWIIFVDSARTIGIREHDEQLLRVHSGLSRFNILSGNAPVANYVSYIPNGQSRKASGAMQGGTLTLCSKLITSKGRKIVVSLGPGRPRVSSDYPNCQNPSQPS